MGCNCKKNKSKLSETKRTVSSKKSPQFGVSKDKVVKLTESDLKNLINTNFGKGNPLIEFSVKQVFKKKIILIMCSNSEKLIYLKKLFYIRKGPGVECIQTPEEMIEYLEQIKST